MIKLEEDANADRESLESGHGSPYAFSIHLEAMKRQDGLGASPTGQRLPERSYGSWRAIWKAGKALKK